MNPRSASTFFLTATVLMGCANRTGAPDPFSLPKVPPVLTSLPTLTFAVPAGGATHLDFDVPGRDIFATIDWTNSSDNLVAIFTGRGCHSVNDALAGLCYGIDTSVQSSASTCPAKPRTLRASLYGPTAVRLWIANTGSTDESGVVALTNCADAPDCGATASCAQCSFPGPIPTSCR